MNRVTNLTLDERLSHRQSDAKIRITRRKNAVLRTQLGD